MLLTYLERDLPLLLAAAHGFTADNGSVDDLTEHGVADRVFVHAELGSWSACFRSSRRSLGPTRTWPSPTSAKAIYEVRYNGTKHGTFFEKEAQEGDRERERKIKYGTACISAQENSKSPRNFSEILPLSK